MKKEYNNTAIKTEYNGHGKKIIEFYSSLGFKNPCNRLGTNDDGAYYGVYNNQIDIWGDQSFLHNSIKIITLPLTLDIWI